ncbi:10150_t:CDS:1 [Diversispora eburnea]|uniref:10150_t:CDS:1 n=1 Tax=Diversispora eburnea TaxID=1213867 RepID=A0A9N9BHC9_9GLOM|nr:10150_t:CDS:1 [Diversispora eburnea]
MADSSWSLSSNFSLIHNPSSVWSYGTKPAGYQTTGIFNLLTNQVQDSNGTGIVAWFPEDASIGSSWLGVFYNPNPTTTTLGWDASNKIFPAKSVCMHPSSRGVFSVARFTAPTNGNYSLDVTFAHVDDKATTIHTGAYIVYNNLEMLWETDLVGIGDSDSFKSIDSGFAVRENETIDFIVGVGSDATFVNDMTLARVDIRLLVATSTTEILPKNTNPTNSMTGILPTPTNSNGNQSSIKVGIIIGSLGVSLSLIMAVILVYFYYKYRKNMEYQQRNMVTSGTDQEVIER